MEELKKVKRESYRNQSKQDWMDGHSFKGQTSSIMSKSAPSLNQDSAKMV